jgi:hypothetical protein
MAKKKAAGKRASAKATTSPPATRSKKTTANSTRPVATTKDDLEAVRAKLQTLLVKPDTEKEIVKLLLALDETQRRALSSFCLASFRKARKNQLVEDPPGTFFQNRLIPPGRIAVFCTANITEIKKLGHWGVPDSDLILDVLDARQPNWVGQFVEFLLGRSNYWNSWKWCREFVRRGLCAKPDNP